MGVAGHLAPREFLLSEDRRVRRPQRDECSNRKATNPLGRETWVATQAGYLAGSRGSGLYDVWQTARAVIRCCLIARTRITSFRWRAIDIMAAPVGHTPIDGRQLRHTLGLQLATPLSVSGSLLLRYSELNNVAVQFPTPSTSRRPGTGRRLGVEFGPVLRGRRSELKRWLGSIKRRIR